MEHDGYQELANAIVIRAASDPCGKGLPHTITISPETP